MVPSPRLWFVVSSGFCLALGASCLIYNEELLEDETGAGANGTGANGGTGGTGTGGGMGGGMGGEGGSPSCTSAEQCPGTDTTCRSRTCIGGSCGVQNAAVGTACAQGVCDGAGQCVECTLPQHCNPGEICTNQMCVVSGPVCGNNTIEGSEECDDGNTEPFDTCASTCLDPTTHLLISEFAVQPTAAEFIEIYNPTNASISLSQIYLADYNTYYTIATGGGTAPANDFNVRFPNGATIAAKAFVTVALNSGFQTTYGIAPDYDVTTTMVGSVGSNAGLTNGDEMIVLYQWNGSATTVTDVDYVVYGNTSDAMDKSGVPGYANETPVGSQIPAVSPNTDGRSLHRCDTAEASETKTGGNGQSNHDETSESGTAAWKESTSPSPKAAPAVGFCP